MNSTQQPDVEMKKSIVFLVLAALGGTLLLNLTEENTREQREQNAMLYESRMLKEVLPEKAYDQEPGLTRIFLNETLTAFPVFIDGRLTALAVTVTDAGGYVGPIRLLVGINADGRITGVRVTEHRETPGLGDKIEAEKSAWINSFDGYALEDISADDWALQRDGGHFDHISGATITSRSVVRAVLQALQAHYQWRSEAPSSETARNRNSNGTTEYKTRD